MTTLRPLRQRQLNAWRTLDRLMCAKAGEPGRQRRYTDVPRLRLLFAGLQTTCDRPETPPADHPVDVAQRKAHESWWHTGFPGWWTL
ncbi:MAG: hypothetical protein H6942_10545 [Candidatus Accumulibacter sp.]|nr:hypothetical protein [Accumulibacter sp.]MCP5248952.1 hypothetical protein [Accumulibacter sp.]